MKTGKLLPLAALAAVLCVLAYVTSSRRSPERTVSDRIGKPVLPALQDTDTLNAVERIVVRSTSSTVTVERAESGWVAADRHGYPAEFGKIRDFLRKLADLKIGQVLAGGPRQAATLGLLAPSDGGTNGSPDSAGTIVELFGKGNAEIARFTVGKEYVRKSPGGNDFGMGGLPDGRYLAVGDLTALVSETLSELPTSPQSWLSTDLVNVPSSDIAEITVTRPDGASVALRRSDPSADLLPVGMAADEEADTSKVSTLTAALSYLNFQDVAAPTIEDAASGLDKPTVLTARTVKGQVFTLNVGGKPADSSDRYIRLRAAFEQPAEPAKPVEPSASDAEKSEAEKTEAKKQAEEEVKRKKEESDRLAAETKTLDERLSKWVFIAPSYKVDGIDADRSALIKKKEEPKKTEEAPKTTPPSAGATEPPEKESGME